MVNLIKAHPPSFISYFKTNIFNSMNYFKLMKIRELAIVTLMKIANVSEIPEGRGTTVLLDNGDEIALFKVNGKVFALENACPHMGGPLGEGEVEFGCVICPWHGYQFDITNGKCTNVTGYQATPVDIEVKGDEVFLR